MRRHKVQDYGTLYERCQLLKETAVETQYTTGIFVIIVSNLILKLNNHLGLYPEFPTAT